MALRHEQPIARIGAPTPTILADIQARTLAADLRARRRYLMARLAANTNGSLAVKRNAIMAAMNSGLIPAGAYPTRETVRQLMAKWQSGDREVGDFYDAPRSGRPAFRLPIVVEQKLKDLIESGLGRTPGEIITSLENDPEFRGPMPTPYQVSRRLAQVGRLVRSAARHGSRAGDIDALPQSRVPVRWTHEMWALDELTLPVFHRQYSRKWRRWVSVRADVVLIVDVRSGAVVGYYITDSSRRVDDRGEQALGGFDADDVLSAILSAACPELAPNATREFAGFLPARIRWDNASAHKALASWIQEQTTLEIDTRRIPKRRATSNGAVERRVGILKSWCRGIHGHMDAYLPTDQVWNEAAANPAAERTLAAGSTPDRAPRRLPIDPSQLLSLDELRDAFDRVVQRYNKEHVNRMVRAAHADVYWEYLIPGTPRNGEALVRSLPLCTTRVQREGVVHHRGGIAHAFRPQFAGLLILPDTPVSYYADPVMRGVFALFQNRLHFLQPTRVWALDPDGAAVGRAHATLARGASDHAAELRLEAFAGRVGEAGVVDATLAQRSAVERFEARKAGAKKLPPYYQPPNAPPPPPETVSYTPGGVSPDAAPGGINDGDALDDRTDQAGAPDISIPAGSAPASPPPDDQPPDTPPARRASALDPWRVPRPTAPDHGAGGPAPQ
jgi:hypothetical protein